MHAFECLVKSSQKVRHCHKRVYIRIEAYIYIYIYRRYTWGMGQTIADDTWLCLLIYDKADQE